MRLTVDSLRPCLEGAVPAVIATCASDGTPNVSYVSQVHYVDSTRVALSFQFFNKTRENVLVNPRATVLLVHPDTSAQFRLDLRYLDTETSGPLFESMKAKLAGIASHTGMTGVFRLRGSDVYEVLAIDRVAGTELPAPLPTVNLLAAVRDCARRMSLCTDLASLIDHLLEGLEASFGVHHAMVLLVDASARTLYSVASRGYEWSGIGAEIPLGHGVIGVAARERTPIRISHATSEYGYGRAIRHSTETLGMGAALALEIPMPGLPESCSQLAVPIIIGEQLLGVLFVESTQEERFGYDHEDALVAIAGHFGTALRLLQQCAELEEEATAAETKRTKTRGAPSRVRHYHENDSIFIDEDYLIKGVAGAILWKLLREYRDARRVDFSNRELRLDPSIPLPELSENLEARLLLLQRRLQERCEFLRIEKTGRGRFRLQVARPIELDDIPAA